LHSPHFLVFQLEIEVVEKEIADSLDTLQTLRAGTVELRVAGPIRAPEPDGRRG
jgi:hypothetical protein